MRCVRCKREMKHSAMIKFNEHTVSGWTCSCGDIYYSPEDAQRILLLNKLSKETVKAKLGRIRSNLIIRVPKDIETALNLKEGSDVILKVDQNTLRILKTLDHHS